jgi:PAS domain S-box-containing protein
MISALYIDDEVTLLEIGKLFLEQDGVIQVDIVCSVNEAIERIQKFQYDVIISDFEMPELSGLDLLIYLRNHGNDIPFILFTGRGREEIVIQALNNGADYYLQKGGFPKAVFAELIHKIKLAVERRRNINALKFSEQRLYDILNFLPDATFAINKTGEIILWNKAMEKLTKISASNMIGKGNFEYSLPFYEKRRPLLIDLINTPFSKIEDGYLNFEQDGEILTAEIEVLTSNGQSRFLWGKASPLFNQDGVLIGAIETVQDITEKRVAERNNARLASIVEYSKDAIFIISLDGEISSWNTSAEKMYGYTSNEVIGKDFSFLISSDQSFDFFNIIQKIQYGEFIDHVESLHRKKDNEVIFVSLSFSSIRDSCDNILFISVIGRNITDIKKAQAALFESEKRYRNVVEDQTELICRFRPDGTYLFVNEAYCRYFNKDKSDILNTKFVPKIFETDRTILKEYFNQLSEIGETGTIEHRIVMPNGDIRWQHWSDKRIIDEIGQTLEYQSVGIDITDRKRAEEELFQKNIELQVAYSQIAATEEELRQNYEELSMREEDLQNAYDQLKIAEEELRQQYEDSVNVEKQLRENEEHFQMMVESAPDAIYITNGQVFLYVNPVFTRLLGAQSADEFIGKPIWKRIDPKYLDNSLERVQSVIHNQKPVERKEVIYLKMDNTPVYVESSASSIRYKNEIVSLVFLRDITDYKYAYNILRNNEEKYRFLVETTRTGYVITDSLGIVLDANYEYVRLSGHTRLDDIIGNNVLKWIADDYCEKYIQAMQKCIKKGFVHNLEVFLIDSSDRRIPVVLNATALTCQGSVQIFSLCQKKVPDESK